MGFPSPASDYTEDRLSLDEHLILYREATLFVTAIGSIPEFGISCEKTLGAVVTGTQT